jgi:S-adenosylmethionine:tRNA-ribosyltransferase-isomerase (queuine synthetase)
MRGRQYNVKSFEQYKVPKRAKREEDEAVKEEYKFFSFGDAMLIY